MERENRYLVIKRSDLTRAEKLMKPEAMASFYAVCEMVDLVRSTRGIPPKTPLCCVVVEHDWPEYEPTWKAIEKRVDARTEEQNSQRGG